MIQDHNTNVVVRTLCEFGDVFEDLVALAAVDSSLLYLNRAGRKLTGVGDREDISNYSVQTFYPGWSSKDLTDHPCDDGPSGVSVQSEEKLITLDGRSLPTLLTVYARRSGSRGLQFCLIVAKDLSDRHQIENERANVETRLVEACRMETIGRLAAGVAGNLDRTLGQITDHISTALRRPEESRAVRTALKSAMQAVDSSRANVRRIIDTGSPSSATREFIRIKQVVRDAVSLARASFPGTIVVRQHLDDPCDPIAIGPVRIQEIILNLILNARDTLERTGGVIDVKLDSVETGVRPAGYGDRPQSRRYARVTVCDNGPGLPAEVLAHMFEPSVPAFPASAPYHLDLSTVNHLVKECGGSVVVHNRIGKGTSFHIFLPAAAPENNGQSTNHV